MSDNRLGYDPKLGYDHTDHAIDADAGPAGPTLANLTPSEQADLEPFYCDVVAEHDYDPEQRKNVIFAEFALGPNRGRVRSVQQR